MGFSVYRFYSYTYRFFSIFVLLDLLLGARSESRLKSLLYWNLFSNALTLLPNATIFSKWKPLVTAMLRPQVRFRQNYVGVFMKKKTSSHFTIIAKGLPDPCCDHPVVMCTFARKALQRMGGVVRTLETYLGPGTADLSMRIGIHSGPIMAGVLRGEKTRFQLFGDTMSKWKRRPSSTVE